MNKKNYLLYAICLLFIGWGCIACHPNRLTEQRIMELYRAIPDRGVSDTASMYLTSDLYQTISDAFECCSKHDDYMNDGEFLLFFVNGNGGLPEEDERVISIVRYSVKDPIHAEATIDDYYWNNHKLHTLKLMRVGNEWLLDDFDEKKQQCQEYIASFQNINK